MMTGALFAATFSWPDLKNQRVLVVGLGGGSDAICAHAIARGLGPDVAYANTKHALEHDLIRVSPHIGWLPDGAAIRGSTKIERRLPRGPHNSPLVLACARDEPTDALARELAALAFDRVIGVDTGGDVLDTTPRGNRGRDRRMVEVLRRLAVPVLVAVLAPGSDGQQSSEALQSALLAEVAAGRYRGAFSLSHMCRSSASTAASSPRSARRISSAPRSTTRPIPSRSRAVAARTSRARG